MSTTTETTEAIGDAIMDLEPALADLHSLTGILGHLATSDHDPSPDQITYVETRLIETHRTLARLWARLWEERKAEHEAHAAELAKIKAAAEEAAPGSLKQIKRADAMLCLLRAGNTVMAERVAAMEAEIAAALAERAEA